jgi:riboflavin biosynthesis pyrimidine reductase
LRFRRLLPAPGEGAPEELLSDLDLGARAPADRPYVIANFVASADGRAAHGGRSEPLGDAGDREMFFFLRTLADAVLAGTGTLAAEPYNRLVGRPERRAAREARGLEPDPLLATITRSGRVPPVALAADPDSSFVVLEGPLRPALERLRGEHGVRSVLCEGGPTLFAALLAEGLVDELFLTLSPVLVGGDELGVAEGHRLADLARLELRSLLVREDSLFLRYRLG